MSSTRSLSHDATYAPDDLGGLGQEGGGIDVATPYFTALISALIASGRRDEGGQGLAEYALILALIAMIAIVALLFLGSQVSTALSKVGGAL